MSHGERILATTGAAKSTSPAQAGRRLRTVEIGKFRLPANGGEVPFLIDHIDAIARLKGRDVLYVTFPECENWFDVNGPTFDWEDYAARNSIISWLNKNRIGWVPCANFAHEHLMESYGGQIYVDVRFDPDDETYRKVREFFENPDETAKIERAKFWYVQLAMAMKNKHHDEPGFWEEHANGWRQVSRGC